MDAGIPPRARLNEQECEYIDFDQRLRQMMEKKISKFEKFNSRNGKRGIVEFDAYLTHKGLSLIAANQKILNFLQR